MKSGPLLNIGFILALFLSLSANSLAESPKSGVQGALLLAAGPAADEDEEDDEEEEAVDSRDRVREVQDWIRRRDAERKQGLEGLPQPNTPELATPFPKYFRDRGYDENGYRRLDGDINVKLREEPYDVPRYHRHYYGGRHSYHSQHYSRSGGGSHHQASSHFHHSRGGSGHSSSHGSKGGHGGKHKRR